MSKNSNVAKITTKLDAGFFNKWLSFLTPFHKLTPSERLVLSIFLKKRHELTVLVRDEHILDNILSGQQTKKEIREEANMSVGQFNIVMSKLKKVGVISNNKINKRYIPNIEHDASGYMLILNFVFDENDIHR